MNIMLLDWKSRWLLVCSEQMGALKYVEELQKKKQSDVLRFLLRVRCWEVGKPFLPAIARSLSLAWIAEP